MKRIKACILFICVTLLLSSCQISKGSVDDKGSIVQKVLDNISARYPVINYSQDNRNIWIDVENTVQASDVKKEIQQKFEENNIKGYEITVHTLDMKQVEKEHRWSMIDFYVFENLWKKEKYKGVRSKLTNITLEDPAIVAISTPIMDADPNAKEYATQIQKEVNVLLQRKKMKKLIEGDAYKIVIYDEQNHPIN